MIFSTNMTFLRPIVTLLWTLSIEVLYFADTKKFVEDMQATHMEIADISTKQKMEKREQNSIDNYEKREGAPSENHLMGKVKVKNEILSEVPENRKRIRETYKDRIREWMGEYYATKPLQARTFKPKKNNLGGTKKIVEANKERL